MSDYLSERFPEIPWGAFLELYGDLPQQGPGSDRATRAALAHVPDLPADAIVYDVGCGTGRQTLVLARELAAPVFAVDVVPGFLETLGRRAQEEGLAGRIHVHCMDMHELEAAPGSIDLIWSEGSIYFIGFAEALVRWRPLLRPGGTVVASHATWLTADPPAEALELFAAELPDMTDAAGNVRLATAAGYEVIHRFALPAEAWWEGYYTPLSERIEELRSAAANDTDLAQVIRESEHEIDVFRRCQGSYTYVFYVMRKTGTGG